MAQAKTYRVVGALPVYGNKPGAEFAAVLSQEQEEYFLAAGHIAIVPVADDGLQARRRQAGADKKENA